MSDLPTHLLVGAAQRAATEAGAGFYIRHRGEAGRGTLLLVVNDLQGVSRLYRQIWDGETRRLEELQQGTDAELDEVIVRERDFDPDLWVIEIEDKQGRLFFDTIFQAAFPS